MEIKKYLPHIFLAAVTSINVAMFAELYENWYKPGFERIITFRKERIEEFRAVAADKPGCEKALKALQKPYIEDRQSAFIFGEAPTSPAHFRHQHDEATSACASKPPSIG